MIFFFFFMVISAFFNALFSVIITKKIGTILKLYDTPSSENHKNHDSAVSPLGGLMVAISFCFGVAVLMWLFPQIIDAIKVEKSYYISVYGSFTFIFLVGFIDDWLHLSAIFKLISQIIVACTIVLGGDTFFVITNIDPIFCKIITILWFIFICNAMNFLDNMNGLFGGLSLGILVFFFLLNNFFSFSDSCYFYRFSLIIYVFFAMLIFFRNNYPKASLFMGDSGSMLVSTGLAFLAVYFQQNVLACNNNGWTELCLVITPFAIPIVDCLVVIYLRIKEKRPIYIGDNAHISHRFVDDGSSRTMAVAKILLIHFLVCFLTFIVFFDVKYAMESGFILRRYNFSYTIIALYCVIWGSLFFLCYRQLIKRWSK